MQQVIINSEPVELYKVLKIEGLVGSGGEARRVISEGLVQLNGETETRKRKKVSAGDIIEFAGQKLMLQLRSGD